MMDFRILAASSNRNDQDREMVEVTARQVAIEDSHIDLLLQMIARDAKWRCLDMFICGGGLSQDEHEVTQQDFQPTSGKYIDNYTGNDRARSTLREAGLAFRVADLVNDFVR
jgi:hypothetical protein